MVTTNSGAYAQNAPEPATPLNGTTLSDFRPTLAWQPVAGAVEYNLVVMPFNGDGPGVDVSLASTMSYKVPAPPMWYGLLPDMTYTWMVRARVDADWGPWSEAWTFRTPAAAVDRVSPRFPTGDERVPVGPIRLRWANAQPDVWYYEVQVATDPSFTPERVVAGGLAPLDQFWMASLPNQTRYYWRVRPRVQGDGLPGAWSQAASFIVDSRLQPRSGGPPARDMPPVGPGDLRFGPISIGTARNHCVVRGHPIPAGATTVYALAPFEGSHGWYWWQAARDGVDIQPKALDPPYVGLEPTRTVCVAAVLEGPYRTPTPASGDGPSSGGGGGGTSDLLNPLPPGEYAVHLRAYPTDTLLQSLRFTIR